nr:PREDICTED: RWD domain-containing protein 1 [Bemisia tabaci]
MDYAAEQQNEVEALESIYFGEMEVLSVEPYTFLIPIKSDEYDPETNLGLFCSLKFEYTPNYPEEVPVFTFNETIGLEEDDEERLMEHLQEQAQENLGTVMVFTLVSAAQEWLNLQSDEKKKAAEEEEEKRLLAEEEAEKKRFEGTRVTIESFKLWKEKFDLEMQSVKKSTVKDTGGKLTGKELFMTDKSLNESDLKFLEEGDAVKVDEALFQELDELDVNDDELNELSD